MSIEICTISPDDWPLWRSLRLRALTENPAAFGSRLEDWRAASEARWRERLGKSGSANFVARSGGAAVGMASGVPADAIEVAELVSMWVAPEARGRGVGDALVSSVVRWARSRGARELRLDVTAANSRAVALYARHGFVDRGAASETGERAMVKALGPARDSAADASEPVSRGS
ncbi:MAG: N-acetyltransferase family protein [Planctomycetota bacterium]